MPDDTPPPPPSQPTPVEPDMPAGYGQGTWSDTAHDRGNVVREVVAAEQFADQERAFLDVEDERMITTIGAALHDHGPLEAAGVDSAAVLAVDPQYTDASFVVIARESYLLLAKARSLERPDDIGDLLTDSLFADVTAEEREDVAKHQLPIHPDLELSSAVVVALGVDAAGQEVGTIHFEVSAAHLVRQPGTNIEFGSLAHLDRWSEDWQFTRDPKGDTAAQDEAHIVAAGEKWMVAHRGWRVSHIQVNAAPPA